MHQISILDNGLRVVSTTVPHVRSVCIGVFVGAGSRYESVEQAGISHFVEHLLFKGTKGRPSAREISEAIEGVGGVLNGGTDKEVTVYWAKMARPHFRLATDVLADMVRNSIFDPLEIEKERRVIVEEIAMSLDSPQQRVGMLIDEAVWPNQALGRDVAGSKDSVSALTRQMLLDYHRRQYNPSNAVVSVAGDMSHDEVLDCVNQTLGDWAGGTSTTWFPALEGRAEPGLMLEARETEQAHLCLALRGVPSLHPDRFTFDLLNIVLGEGMSSRLFLELREKRGLAYDVHSYVSHFFDSGSLTVYAGVEPQNTEAVIKVILEEVSRLKEEDIPPAELAKAKEMGKGHLLLRMEDTRNVASWTGNQELLAGKIRTVDEVVSLVEAVTAADIRRVAGELFCSKGLSLALVSPCPEAEKLRSLLAL